MGRLHVSLTTRLSIKDVQACNQVGTLGGDEFSERDPFFKKSPIVIIYVQHIFERGEKFFNEELRLPVPSLVMGLSVA